MNVIPLPTALKRCPLCKCVKAAIAEVTDKDRIYFCTCCDHIWADPILPLVVPPTPRPPGGA